VLKRWKPEGDSVNRGQTSVSSPDCSSSNHSQDGSSITSGYFTRYCDSGSPFDVGLDEVQEEDILVNCGVRVIQALDSPEAFVHIELLLEIQP
jgi:hypothetical protein